MIGAQLAARHGVAWQDESVEEADVEQELTVLGRVVHRNKDGVAPSGAMSTDSVGIVVRNKCYRLDVLSVPHTVLVPGMHVAVKAVKAHATRLRVAECWTDAALAPAPLATRSTRVLIAAGPYTARTDLRYEGLELLFARIRTTAPDVVLLVSNCDSSPAHSSLTSFTARTVRRCRTPSRAGCGGDVAHRVGRVLRGAVTCRSTRCRTASHTVRTRALTARCSPALRVPAALLLGKCAPLTRVTSTDSEDS